ncbi:MAG TPA: metal-dependent hydrolase [Lachnospiraceae bacterium]|nr:metal-dependent hydrolase [Lachnospiraceae bacterium]
MREREELRYADCVYPYTVVRSDRKTLAVQVRPGGEVQVRAPRKMKQETIRQFVWEHREWLRRKVAESRAASVGEEYSPQEKARLREQAREILRIKADYFARLMGVQYNRIFIKEQKTVWGSCSAKGNLNFNWKLILAGPDQLEYVVVHELAHLKEMNHSPAFWREVENVLPDYRERRKRLKEFRP